MHMVFAYTTLSANQVQKGCDFHMRVNFDFQTRFLTIGLNLKAKRFTNYWEQKLKGNFIILLIRSALQTNMVCWPVC